MVELQQLVTLEVEVEERTLRVHLQLLLDKHIL